MAVLKCKMCGGELSFEEGISVCECEYCGCKQTVPNIDNEKKAKQYVRANKLRAACDFDKAAGVYESIIEDYEDEAEAYWGLILCKYGIEYVTDPATAKKVPTCHRSCFDSVMDDEDFEMVMEMSDPVARSVYREQAKDIEEIRKKIIEVSQKEEPYDIFICYKEAGEDGQRTLDSVLAQDVYDAFMGKGYRVFFSRITLEDKLGKEYEPYIFAALNSAKVMLVFGTSYDNYNAVWVKNEWSRYLKLMEKDNDKYLIPCYKNIDTYDMPAEFKNLQGQDMSKIGFMQDLIKGVEKILPLKKDFEKAVETLQNTQVTSAPNVVSLLERAEMFLEDGKWDSAEEYCERVLDIEPKNAKAFLYKACAENRQSTLKDLIKVEEKIEESSLFRKALRFADESTMQLLEKVRLEVNTEEKERKMKSAQKIQEIKRLTKALNSSKLVLIACQDNRTIGLKADGTIVMTSGQGDVRRWTDIVSIACKNNRTVGLKRDGSVLATGKEGHGQCKISGWKNIVAIDCGVSHIAGLGSDGRVLAIGKNVDGECNVSKWTDIVAVACGQSYTIGLRSDGRIFVTGKSGRVQSKVSSWTDIVSLACGYEHTIGLKADGRVVATGQNEYGQCSVSGWTDIVAVACGESHTVGLKADGRVVATGKNEYGQCSVSGWTDIVAVACGQFHTVGLRADGSVVAKGNNEKGQCNVDEWRLFNDENQLIKLTEERIACFEEARELVEKQDEEARELVKKQDEEERVLAEKQAEEARKLAEKQAEERKKLSAERCARNVCQHCGGEFKGMLIKKCTKCGKGKDY